MILAYLKKNSMSNGLYRLNQKAPQLVTLIIMSSFASMGAVIFTPALPQIASYFHISNSYSQLTITLFLVGYALGQLIYGPISNRLGRKHSFYVGIGIATLGSLVSILSEPFNSFYLLIIGRMLEALGSSAGLVIAYTIIHDFYYPPEARRVISYMTLAFAIMPGVATLVGSVLIAHWHWLACFYFMLIYGLTLIVPVHFLKETALTLDREALHVRRVSHNYQVVSHNRLMIYCSIFWGLSTMGIYVYAASAPIIAIRFLHLPEEAYGFVGFIPFFGTALGALISAWLSKTFSIPTLVKFGFSLIAIAALLFALFFFMHVINLLTLLLPATVYMFGACVLSANLASLAGSVVEDKANGVSVMNFINIGIAVCGTFALAILPGTQLVKLPLMFILTVIIMFLVRWAYKRK